MLLRTIDNFEAQKLWKGRLGESRFFQLVLSDQIIYDKVATFPTIFFAYLAIQKNISTAKTHSLNKM